MDIQSATRSYEKWLTGQTALVRPDLRLKHDRMRESPFVFLRATFYRWIRECPRICRRAYDAKTVLSVGNLHVENYRTWVDLEGRLVWGVNDVNEAAMLPYTNDRILLTGNNALKKRLANSALPLRD